MRKIQEREVSLSVIQVRAMRAPCVWCWARRGGGGGVSVLQVTLQSGTETSGTVVLRCGGGDINMFELKCLCREECDLV